MDDKSLDAYDRKILDILSKEGRISVTDLAPRVGLSKTPCMARMKKLQDNGIIIGYTAQIDQTKIGRNHVAFAEIKLHDTKEKALNDFNEAVRKIPEIEQCHMIAGSFDYLLKVRTKDIQSYRRFLGEQISTLPNIANSSTYVSMQSVIESSN